MRNCNMDAKCVKCGELHLTKDCTLPPRRATDDRSKIRCANCSQNHTSGSSATVVAAAAVAVDGAAGGGGYAGPDQSELFSLHEFMNLASDLFTRLSSCKTKAQQFLALSELMIKYVYNG